ncbi:MAG: ATP-binding protein [Cyanobacteriota bacterium]|nr:ATP-binding protein [Cyanobacteriota bacterium]
MINSIDRLVSKLSTPSFYNRNFPLVTLLVLGILGNYWHLPLLFGVDFLLGSIAVFIVIELYGIFWGVFAATIASSYTFLLWGHPYGIIIFTCEALFVSWSRKHWRYSLLLLDGMYWLCIGMPLIFLFYRLGMGLKSSEVLLVLFKQPVNCIFNVLVASLLLTYLPILRSIGGSKLAREVSLKETLVHLLVAFVFFPSLILMTVDSRSMVQKTYLDMNTELKTLSFAVAEGIDIWHQPYRRGIENLSQFAMESNLKPSPQLQSAINTLVVTLPDIDSVSVIGAEGAKVASYFKRQGIREAGNFTGCDRQFQTAVSDGFLNINRPLVEENNFLGCVRVKINLNSLQELLEEASAIGRKDNNSLQIELTLTDSLGKAIATTREDLEPNSQYNQALEKETNPRNSKILNSISSDTQKFSGLAFKELLYQNKSLPKTNTYLPWNLIIELPTSPAADYLNGIYGRVFETILFLGFLTTAIGTILSQKLLESIDKLVFATRQLPERLLRGVEFEMPQSSALELKGLVANVRIMASSLQDNFTEVNELKLKLTKEIARRKQEQNRVKELNENLEKKVKQRTANLEISLAQLKELIQNIKAGILVENEEGYITLINQEFCEVFAIESPPQTLIGKICAETTKKAKDCSIEPDEFVAGIKYISEQKSAVVNEELQLRDGRTLERDYIPITVSGKFYGNLWLYRDISERKRVEIEIKTALAKETELNQLKSRLMSVTSHEFRTPLTVMSSSVGILKTFAKKLSEEQKLEHLDRIQAYIKHTTKLLDEILLVNQVEAGKLQFQPKCINLVSFCKKLTSEIQLAASQHNLVFSAGSTADCTQAIIDEKLLRQTLTNLLSNAIKYSPDGGEVKFDFNVAGDRLIFLVKDSGIGIPTEDQKQLFESFHRATNVGSIQGTGLGLSIVKKCVELHGGDVKVESEVGKGTTFIVTLPFVKTTT